MSLGEKTVPGSASGSGTSGNSSIPAFSGSPLVWWIRWCRRMGAAQAGNSGSNVRTGRLGSRSPCRTRIATQAATIHRPAAPTHTAVSACSAASPSQVTPPLFA
jgi:hypothetical protein